MPESTKDIQGIDQMVEEADTLVAELEAFTTGMLQSTSDEGPTIEPQEWTPPAESPSSDPESSADSTPEAAEPAAEPAADSTAEPSSESASEPTAESDADQSAAEPIDDAAATVTQDTADAVSRESDPIAESASDTDPADQPDPAFDPESAIESSESQAGQAVRLDDPPGNEPESISDDAEEPICEVESEDSVHELAGDILMDEAPTPEPHSERNLLSDARAGSIEDTTEASERVRSLDDELARLADEMIEGEDSDEGDANVLVSAPKEDDRGSPGDEEPGPGGQAPPSPGDDAPSPSSASDESNPEKTDQPATSQPAATRPAAECPAAFKDRVLFYAKIAARRSIEIARERGPVIAAQLEPVARLTCERASRPLEKKKPIVRQTIGWVAVSTALYASVVLFYVAFVRKPTMIEPDHPGTTLIDNAGRPIARHPDGD